MTEDLSRRAGQPLHEALWPTDLFTQGIGWVITARFKSNEVRVQVVSFWSTFFVWARSQRIMIMRTATTNTTADAFVIITCPRFPSPLVTKASLSTAEAPGKPRSKPAALCRICSNTVAQETLRT